MAVLFEERTNEIPQPPIGLPTCKSFTWSNDEPHSTPRPTNPHREDKYLGAVVGLSISLVVVIIILLALIGLIIMRSKVMGDPLNFSKEFSSQLRDVDDDL